MTVAVADRAHLLKAPLYAKTKCGKRAPKMTEERIIKINSGEIPKCHACWFRK